MGDITVGQAAKRIGIPTEVLKELCDDGYVENRKGPGGHYYLDEDELPQLPWVSQLYEHRWRDQLEQLLLATKAVEREIESFKFDVEEALTLNAGEPLGDITLMTQLTGDYDTLEQTMMLRTLNARFTWKRLRELRQSVSELVAESTPRTG